MTRSPPGNGRHAVARCRFPDNGPVSPADPAPRQGDGFRHPAGVRCLCGDRARQRLLARRVVTADAVELSRSEEHTSELQSLMRISYAVFCLKKKTYILMLPTYEL